MCGVCVQGKCQMGLWTLDCSGAGSHLWRTRSVFRSGIYEGDIRTGVSGWRSMFSPSRFGLLLLMRASFFLLLKTIYCVPFWKYNEKKPDNKLGIFTGRCGN